MRFLASLAVLLLVATALPALAQSDRNDPRTSQSAQQYGQSPSPYGQQQYGQQQYGQQQYGQQQDSRPGQGYGRERRRERGIQITSAFYGVEHRACEATEQVARICDGRPNCTVPATNRLCGDPMHGVTKVLTVYYNCHGRSRASTRWEGGYLGIRCD